MSSTRAQGFTLIELLATIAIIAVLATTLVVSIPNLLNWAAATSNRKTLDTLNSALQNYKTLGGITSAHSLQGLNTKDKIDAIIAVLKTGVTLGNTNKPLINNSANIDTTLLYASGTGKSFIFSGYGGTTAADPQLAGTFNAHIIDEEHVTLTFNATATISFYAESTTGYYLITKNSEAAIQGNIWAATPVPVVPGDTIKLTPSNSSGATAGHLTRLDVGTTNTVSGIAFNKLTSFTTLNLPNQRLSSLDLTGATAITSLNIVGNSLMTSLDVSSLSNLAGIFINYTNITSIDISGLASLINIAADHTPLTSLRAVGYQGTNNTSSYAGICDMTYSNLNAAALNQFFTDLGTARTTNSQIGITGNPGAGSCNTSIATAKGYVVIN